MIKEIHSQNTYEILKMIYSLQIVLAHVSLRKAWISLIVKEKESVIYLTEYFLSLFNLDIF